MAKIRILIVDDDTESSDLLREDLEKMGVYEVFSENRGLFALEAALECRPDIVLLDIMIPDLDGPSIAVLFEKKYPRPLPKIVFLSSLVTPEDERRGTIGGYRFISKYSPRKKTELFLQHLVA